MHDRRQFLGAALGAGAAILAPRLARAAEARIEIIPAEPIGTIAPEIYGHFVEHLGGVVYDGIWVGEGSRIPNVGGIRKEIVERLRQIHASVVRWPGGCFADQYDWRDGTGPRASRPRRTNFWVDVREWPASAGNGPQRFEPNQFGTVEFARFCRLAGAQPYVAANVRSLSPQDFWRWVEYCNAPAGSTTTADQRASDGEREPLDVRFWGVGNESWGCGGNFTAEEYAAAFRRYTAWLPWAGKLSLIGAGPNSGELDWTRRFFAAADGRGRQHLWGWALHHYSWNVSGGRTTGWREGKGDALQFDPEQHYEILAEADKMESLVTEHWNAMEETDPQHRVKLVVDEWGAWHKPGTEPFPEALLGQQNTMRDALLAGRAAGQLHAQRAAGLPLRPERLGVAERPARDPDGHQPQPGHAARGGGGGAGRLGALGPRHRAGGAGRARPQHVREPGRGGAQGPRGRGRRIELRAPLPSGLGDAAGDRPRLSRTLLRARRLTPAQPARCCRHDHPAARVMCAASHIRAYPAGIRTH